MLSQMRLGVIYIFACFVLTSGRRRGRNERQSEEAAPTIVGPPVSVVGIVRGTVALVCNATGNPRPSIDWYKEDNVKVSKNRYEMISSEYDGGIISALWIFNARKRKDATTYTCKASNKIDRDDRQAQVTLIDEADTPSGYPRITDNPNTKTAERNKSVSLQCRTDGTPAPTIRWYKDYLPLKVDPSRITISATGTLNILRSNDNDAGKYHCSATNHYGVVFSEGATIYVKVRRVPPRFSIPPRSQYEVQQNGKLNITCVAVGSPMPNMKWQEETRWGPVDVPKLAMAPNNDEAVVGREVHGRLVGRVVLLVRNARESANFTCVASSAINTIRSSIEVRVKAIPKPPVKLRRSTNGESSRSLGLRWNSGNKDPVNSYTIYYRLRYDDDANYDKVTDVSSTSFTVTGLKPFTDYEFRVSAENPQGEGNMSLPLYLQTLEAAPSTSPTVTKAYLFGINTVMVAWSEPTTPNGVISQYKLYYSSDDILPVEEWNTKVVEGNKWLTSIRNLTPSVTYSVRVSALNSVGEGPISQAVMVKTEQGVPSQPRNFRGTAVSSNSIRFVWEEPAGDSNQDHQIISYTLVYECNEPHCGRQKQITFPPGSTSFMLLNLHPFTRYRVKLAAQTRFGKGPFTSVISVSTLADIPSAPPQDVQTPSSGENWVRISWQPPLKGNRNGNLTRYTVYYSTERSKDTASSLIAQPGQIHFRIPNLKPYTTYFVWVSASTNIGEGPLSSAIRATTAESVPEGPPQNVTVESLNSTSIRVRWSPVPRPLSNGNIRGYQVAYVVSDVPTSRTHIISTYEGELSKVRENQILEYTVNGLQPKTRYSLSVAAFTIKGAGPQSAIRYATTKGVVPGKPTILSNSEESTALLTWAPPQDPSNDCTGYVLKYRCSNCPGADYAQSEWFVKRFDSTILSFRPGTYDHIVSGWTYTFKLAAVNNEGPGSEATSVLTLPSIVPSEAPRNLSKKTVFDVERSIYGVQLRWASPPWTGSNGQITGYRVYWRKLPANDVAFKSVTTSQPEYLLPNVKLGERYEFQVSAQNSAGEGPRSPSLVVTVFGTTPSQSNVTVTNLRVLEASTNTVWLSWTSPKLTNVRFLVTYIEQSSHAANQTEAMGSEIAVSGLKENSSYNFTVTTYANYGGIPVQLRSCWIIVQTAPRVRLYSPQIEAVSKDDTVSISLSPYPEQARVERFVLVVVPWDNNAALNTDSYNHAALIKNSKTSKRQRRQQAKTFLPYIAAIFDDEFLPSMFSLGDGLGDREYVNKILEPGVAYRVFLRAVYNTEVFTFSSSSFSDLINIPKVSSIFPTNPSAKPATDKRPENRVSQKESTGSSSQLWIIGLVVGCLIVVGLFVGLFFLYLRRTRKNNGDSPLIKYSAPVAVKQTCDKRVEHDPVEMRRQHYQTSGMKSHPPIVVSEMSTHVEHLSANDNLKFSQEYGSIDPGQKFKWENSNLEINKSKNRYANVVAYDHSRLTLSPIDGVPGSDYINANYMSGYRRQNAYIATQGPTRETIPDFWRMVWEQRSSVIVMMTKCEERTKVKCDQYWPSEGSESYGLMKVTLIDEMELATYCVRTMALFKSGCNDRREIKHFQYTAWPDHGVPEHPTPVLNFMRRVKSSYQPDTGPIVVHCSAGVGRAGCFICIDSTLERIKHENTVDIYGQVTCMRAERNYMVQTEDQYIFIHYAILEAINCGNTELPARNLYNHLHKLTTPENGSPITAMELEFKRLACSKAPAARFISANLNCNKFKNRLVNILPYEGSRVYLQPIRGVEGSDYINASFIDGYRQKQAYIATQGPLPDTTDDFWRMLWEHKSTIVVMLTQLNESGRDKCHLYWPEERSERYQYFVVDPMHVYNMPQYVLREFKVTDARDGQSRTIRQFHFTDWPEQAVPKSGEGFIDFIGQVHKTKEQFGQEGPITIHCSAGVGRTGVFITLSIALERMRFENVVDMFQTVKMLRTQRPAMVQTEDQYQFCYRAALEYLGSFDHYAAA